MLKPNEKSPDVRKFVNATAARIMAAYDFTGEDDSGAAAAYDAAEKLAAEGLRRGHLVCHAKETDDEYWDRVQEQHKSLGEKLKAKGRLP